ncbi:VOC family protein, partial [Chloroflexota bacterium]
MENMAKIKGINHVCFVVKSLDEAMCSVVENLGGEFLVQFEVPPQKYKGACYQLGKSIVSFLEATDESSFVAKFIEERGVGVQHIGLEIDNLEEFVDQLESKGIRVDK